MTRARDAKGKFVKLHPTAITAAASVLPAGSIESMPRIMGTSMQERAWRLWRILGVLHFPTTFKARQVGRLGWNVTVNGEQLEPDAAKAAMESVTAPLGPEEVTTRIALNLEVAGEVFYARIKDQWRVLASTKPKLKETLKQADIIVRGLQPDPVNEDEPFTAVMAALGTADQIRLMAAMSRGQDRNRLAQRGILLVPKEGQFPEGDDFQAKLEASMTAPIADEYAASAVVPLKVDFPAEFIDKWKHLVLESPYDDKLMDRIDATIKQFALELDLPPEMLLGNMDSNHWCVDDQTEIFTRDRGWVGHDALSVGDVVRTLNHETGLAEWQPVADVYRAEVEDESMCVMESRTHSSVTTGAHRWPVQRADGSRSWTTSHQMVGADRIITGAPSWDLPYTAKYEDPFVELVAWFWTEGNIGAGDRVTIAQSHTKNPERVDRIRAALTVMFGASGPMRGSGGALWREAVQPNRSSHGGPITVFSLSKAASVALLEAAPSKLVSTSFVDDLTAAQLELFIDVSCQGDGWHYRSGKLDIWQRDGRMLDGFERACILSGRAVSRIDRDGGTCVYALRSTRVGPVKAAQQVQGTATVTRVPYSGTVWCPVTPNGTWLARRKGKTFYTGNSAWLSDEQNVNAFVVPLGVATGEVIAQAMMQAVDGIVDITVKPDPAALLVKSPAMEDVFEGARIGAVGLDFVRRFLGADDSDKPTPKDTELILLMTGTSQAGTGPEAPADSAPDVPANTPSPNGTGTASTNGSHLSTFNLTADVDPRAVRLDQLARRLTDIDFRLLSVLEGLAGMASDHARAAVNVEDVGNQHAVADEMERLGKAWSREVTQARKVLTDLGIDATGFEWDVAQEASAALLVDEMTTYVTENLKKTDSDLPALPVLVLRRVLATAGGSGSATVAAVKVNPPPTFADPQGFAIGVLPLKELKKQNVAIVQWRFRYGPLSRTHPFEPHKAADGQFMTSDGFTSEGYYPSDHQGCECASDPVFREVSTPDEVSEEVA